MGDLKLTSTSTPPVNCFSLVTNRLDCRGSLCPTGSTRLMPTKFTEEELQEMKRKKAEMFQEERRRRLQVAKEWDKNGQDPSATVMCGHAFTSYRRA